MKKKLIGFIACFSFVLAFGLCLFGGYGQSQPTICHAASVTAQVQTVDTVEETPIETPTDEEPAEESEENPTFFGRIWEFLEQNYPEVITTIVGVLTFLLTTILPTLVKKSMKKLDSNVLKSNSTQTEVVDAVNCLIEGYNTLEKELEDYNKTEDERYKMVGAMIVQTQAILDILATVYANSKNLPTGVKDLINLKYAKALKLVENSEELKEIAQSAGAEIVTEVKESETEEV